ncbi:MAG: 2OG-Fe(II) oxygenase [Nitrospira sp.]|nr:2OG-Fe(II) oxygenase [Nitrospira sp.]
MRNLKLSIERDVIRATERVDLEEMRRCYREQNEFVVLEQFLAQPVVDQLLDEVDLLTPDVNRNYVPGHKKGGSVSFYTLLNKAPAILSLYRSPALLIFLSRLVEASLLLCPQDDPHSCALYYYRQPGDHIGFHYDTSYYKGKRYTVLIGLVERSEHCRLVARVKKRGETEEIRETRIPMDPGTAVLFNGDKLWHAVTPLGKGEERVVLTLQYVTNQEMGPFKKMFSNLKDAFAYFGPAALLRWNPVAKSGDKRHAASEYASAPPSPAPLAPCRGIFTCD